ncbi:MAG TPA: alanine racemase [Balneolaceae bacterium]
MNLTHQLSTLTTPALLLDEEKMMTNIARLRNRSILSNITLRPHLKTAKSVDIARKMLSSDTGPATVSTLREAEVFFKAGIKDILYAVGISPQKLPRICALREEGCDLTVLLNSPEQAKAVVEAVRIHNITIPALIEIDCDGHRGGLSPADSTLIDVGRILHQGGSLLSGVLTHAGESYAVAGIEAHASFAERERSAAVSAANRLRNAGLPCPIVSNRVHSDGPCNTRRGGCNGSTRGSLHLL